MNALKLIRNNWKKVTFGCALSGYAIYALKDHFEINNHMRLVCENIANFEVVNGSVPKKVLVVLNPVANKKKAEKSFRKYCEPILHLAGYSVEILRTNHVGHAKSFIENLQKLPDAIVVAGGDGTTSEVVTGLMRRNDEPCPIALLPLGRKNDTVSKYINYEFKNKVENVRALSDMTTRLIKGTVKNENVIQYDVIQDENTENILKPIYGLNQFSWGLLRDIESVKDKYWYFGYLRHHAALMFNSFSKKLNWNFGTDYVYTPPCAGCSNCYVDKKVNVAYKSVFLRNFMPKKKNENSIAIERTNVDCINQIRGHAAANQLNITCKRNANEFYELECKFISSLTPGLTFIKQIPEVTENDIEPSIVLKSRTIQLYPADINENAFYSIDGEEYDVRPIKLSILPNALKVFC